MKLRRDFELPEDDIRFLDSRRGDWEAVEDGKSLWVIMHSHPVPSGYDPQQVVLAVLIPPGYADVQLDMFYVSPALARRDGAPINALSSHSICGDVFQRWSRHRTAANPWRAGEDDLSSHVLMVDGLLEREFGS
jgi:Prokaryotic E2 family E